MAAVNDANRRIHAALMAEGRWHLHSFTLADDTGRLARGEDLAPLRFVSINPRITGAHMEQVLDYVDQLGQRETGAVR